MRLWHYALIPYLPKDMLVSQWRELIAIKRQWEKGTLKHRLVSYVKEHDKMLFLHYTMLVVEELLDRSIKINLKLYNEIIEFCKDSNIEFEIGKIIVYPEHNIKYLKQCYYNLQEKYDRGIISKEEWDKIHKYIYNTIGGNIK